LSKYGAGITAIHINPEKIGARGSSGRKARLIKGIVEATGCQIDIEDDGTIHIFSTDGEAADRAIEQIKAITGRDGSSRILTAEGCRPSRNSARLWRYCRDKERLVAHQRKSPIIGSTG